MARIVTTLVILLGSLAASDRTDARNIDKVPIYRVTAVGGSTKALNDQRSGPARLDFRRTSSLSPEASGEAEVQTKQGVVHIDAEFKHLPEASTFSPHYLTYVLWAISPEGQPLNLGEVLLNDSGHSRVNVTADLQLFALMVTAEPYFSVAQPSDLVVMLSPPIRTGRTTKDIQNVNSSLGATIA